MNTLQTHSLISASGKSVTIDGHRITAGQVRALNPSHEDGFGLAQYIAERRAHQLHGRHTTALATTDGQEVDGAGRWTRSHFLVTYLSSARGGGWNVLGEDAVYISRDEHDAFWAFVDSVADQDLAVAA